MLSITKKNPIKTFQKEERLTGKKAIHNLFKSGDSFFLYPFKVIWVCEEKESRYPTQVLITVTRKSQKRAVARNKIKRRIREAYRKNKTPFYEFLTKKQIFCSIALVYVSKETITFTNIEKKILEIFERLEKQITRSSNFNKSVQDENQ